MPHSKPVQISVCEEDAPSVGAVKGDYLMDNGGPRLQVMHNVPREALSAIDAAHFRSVGSRTPKPASSWPSHRQVPEAS